MAESPRWKVGKWKNHDNYTCTRCAFATLDRGEMVRHANDKHPLGRLDRRERGRLAGIDFASDEAAELAAEAGLTAQDLKRSTPTGATGGYTVADVKAAAKSVTPEE